MREEELHTERGWTWERERDAESGVGVCLLTKSLKSMAVLMNISKGKLVPSSAGTDSLNDWAPFKFRSRLKNTTSKGSYYFHISEPVIKVTTQMFVFDIVFAQLSMNWELMRLLVAALSSCNTLWRWWKCSFFVSKSLKNEEQVKHSVFGSCSRDWSLGSQTDLSGHLLPYWA